MKRAVFCLALFFGMLVQSRAQAIATLRSGDIFDMRLSGMPQELAQDFALQLTVSNEGTVNIPLIGAIQASGATASQLEQKIQKKLIADKIFSKPTVVINVAQNARTVSVGGGVKAPQRVAWSSDLTLSSAIESAGGLDDFASSKNIKVIREGQSSFYDLRLLHNDPSKDPKLLPGDQVYVNKG